MAKKKFDPKAKAKRQKIIAAVGGVLLLGLLAFQVPRTMKMLKQNQGTSSSSSTAAASTTAAPGSTPLAPPALDGSGASVASATATSVDGVSDPSNPLPPAAGQLVSFSKFQSKDPFHQQITNCENGGDSGAGSASASSGSSACATVTKAAAKPAARKTLASGAAVSGKAATTKPASAVAINPYEARVSHILDDFTFGSNDATALRAYPKALELIGIDPTAQSESLSWAAFKASHQAAINRNLNCSAITGICHGAEPR